MKHRAPVVGYNSREKQKYRKSVWECMKPTIQSMKSTYRPWYILILPGLSTKEIDVALKAGISRENLLLVHESEWHVNNEAEWREKYPDIKYYCGLLSDLIPRFKEDRIFLRGANLDLCGNFSPEMVEQVLSICEYADECSPLAFTLGLTMMKGRESTAMVKILEKLKDRGSNPIGLKEKRLEVMLREFGCKVKSEDMPYSFGRLSTNINIVGEGDYVHNKAPMSWVVVEYVSPREQFHRLTDQCEVEAKHVYKEILKICKKSNQKLTREDRIIFYETASKLAGTSNKLSPNLRVFYNKTNGHKTRATPLYQRFLSKDDAMNFMNLYRKNNFGFDFGELYDTLVE